MGTDLVSWISLGALGPLGHVSRVLSDSEVFTQKREGRKGGVPRPHSNNFVGEGRKIPRSNVNLDVLYHLK